MILSTQEDGDKNEFQNGYNIQASFHDTEWVIWMSRDTTEKSQRNRQDEPTKWLPTNQLSQHLFRCAQFFMLVEISSLLNR